MLIYQTSPAKIDKVPNYYRGKGYFRKRGTGGDIPIELGEKRSAVERERGRTFGEVFLVKHWGKEIPSLLQGKENILYYSRKRREKEDWKFLL